MTLLDLSEEAIADKLCNMQAAELIKWALDNFADRVVIGTSFQLTGSVMIDMASKAADTFRVFTVDTLRLHSETYDIMDAVEKRYGIGVERFKPGEKELKDMVDRYGEFLFFDGRTEQEFCCYVRKVEPNVRALANGVDVWITGLRRDQSRHREDTKKAELVEHGEQKILKLAPLADWNEAEVRKYIKDNNVPYNVLFDMGYDSIGCIICSTPLNEGEPPRAGRWRWFNEHDDKKECGIHIPKGGTSI